MKGQRVLVTGAGGFVGSHLAVGLAAHGFQVTGLDQMFDVQARGRLSGIDTIVGRLGRDGLAAIPAPDIVVHAAAVTTGPEDLGISAAEHLRANLDPLLALLAAAGQWRPKHVVFLSSSGVFAAEDGDTELTDRTPPTGGSAYAAAKRAGEILVPSAMAGVSRSWVLRLGYLYGPAELARETRSRVSLVQRWWDAARAGEPLEVPGNDPRRDWTLVCDLAPALIRLLETEPPDSPLHVASPYVRRDSDLAALIAGCFADGRIVVGPPTNGQKPPMAPSRVAALDAFPWTAPEAGILALQGCEVAA